MWFVLLGFFREGQLSTNSPPPPLPKKKEPSRLLFLFLCLFCSRFCCCCCCCTSMKFKLFWCIAFDFALLATTNFRRHFYVFRFLESEGTLFTLTTAILHPLQSRTMLFSIILGLRYRWTRTIAIVFQLKKRVTLCFCTKKNVTINFILFVNWVCLRKAFLFV